MVLMLRKVVTPGLRLSRNLQQKVRHINQCLKVVENDHIKYITEEHDDDCEEKAREEYHEAREKAMDLLYPTDSLLEEIMANLERLENEGFDAYDPNVDDIHEYEDSTDDDPNKESIVNVKKDEIENPEDKNNVKNATVESKTVLKSFEKENPSEKLDIYSTNENTG